MARKIVGVTVGTSINPQVAIEKTAQAKQIAKNTSDIGRLSSEIVDICEGLESGVFMMSFALEDGTINSDGEEVANNSSTRGIRTSEYIDVDCIYNITIGSHVGSAFVVKYDENKQIIKRTVYATGTSLKDGTIGLQKAKFIKLALQYGPSTAGELTKDLFESAFLIERKTIFNKTNEVDVFLFAGQSNMAGRGKTNSTWAETAPAVISGAGYEFRSISDNSKLYPIAEPFGVNENNANGIDDGDLKTGSMVSAFTNAYFLNTDIPLVGVSASKGGSKLNQWQPDGTYLPDAIARFNDCVSFLENNGYTIRHKYVLWCQGESDGDIGTTEENYKSMLQTMLEALLNVGIEKLFMVRIGNCNVENDFDRYTNIIKWQNEIAQSNKDVVMVSTAFAGMRERGLMKDDFHYYQAGYNEVGTYAGVNTAFYVNNGKEPTMYDTEYDNLYFSKKN